MLDLYPCSIYLLYSFIISYLSFCTPMCMFSPTNLLLTTPFFCKCAVNNIESVFNFMLLYILFNNCHLIIFYRFQFSEETFLFLKTYFLEWLNYIYKVLSSCLITPIFGSSVALIVFISIDFFVIWFCFIS